MWQRLCLLLIVGAAGLWPLDAARAGELCGPFPAQAASLPPAPLAGQLAASAAGVQPGRESARLGQGRIVSLPADAGALVQSPSRSGAGSEAILALPKNSSGQISSDFALGPGARIAGSYFSPVICSTVARVTGPAGATPDQLVVNVPSGAVVVANDVYYANASTELKSLEANPAPREDPYASLQYGLAVTGVRYARDLGDGSGVKVALLDSAPEDEHADLSAVRLESIPETEGRALQTGVHGTLMAGVIAASEGNGYGIAGVAPGADLISVPICRPDGGAGGRCSIYHMLRGLDIAFEAEAEIVNLSLSGPPNPLLERGMARLDELGVVVVAAAGNEGTEQPRYPAAYETVVSVGAVDQDGRLFEQSNRGDWVELSAPGVEVLSTVPGNAFAFGSGTSLAAAHVTGMIAVLTEVTQDPKRAKSELFRAAYSTPQAGKPITGAGAAIPEICNVFARLGQPCTASK